MFWNKKTKWYVVARSGEKYTDYEEYYEYDNKEEMLDKLKTIKNNIKKGIIEDIAEGEVINWSKFAKVFYGKV